MNTIQYRFATVLDIDQLVELRVLMQMEVNEVPREAVTPEYLEKVRTYFLQSLENGKYASAVALIGNTMVGTAAACFYEKPPSILGGTGIVGYVTNVYTRKENRGSGIGTNLMKKLNDYARDLKADKLHLGATDDGLQIYRSVGYKEPNFVNLELKF